MTTAPDILVEVKRCAEAASNNTVYFKPLFRLDNWPHTTLVAAAEEIERLRNEVRLLRAANAEMRAVDRSASIAARVRNA
jgi:hypothetical protein